MAGSSRVRRIVPLVASLPSAPPPALSPSRARPGPAPDHTVAETAWPRRGRLRPAPRNLSPRPAGRCGEVRPGRGTPGGQAALGDLPAGAELQLVERLALDQQDA